MGLTWMLMLMLLATNLFLSAFVSSQNAVMVVINYFHEAWVEYLIFAVMNGISVVVFAYLLDKKVLGGEKVDKDSS